MIFKNRKRFDEFVGQRKFEGKEFAVTIDRLTAQRSISQNRYYWVLVTILAEELGYSQEEMHYCLKFKFLRKNEGTGIETAISTTRLDKIEFGEFVEKIKIWAASGDDIPSIVLPDPNTIY